MLTTMYRAVGLGILLLATTSCVNIPPLPTHSEVTDRYANQLTDRQQVVLKLIYDCNPSVPYCRIEKKQIDIALKVVKNLNKEANDLTTAKNETVKQLIECAYQGHTKDHILAIVKAEAARDKAISTAKIVGLWVGCGVVIKSVL